MSDLNVDLYWSFRSPFSYLVTEDLKKLAEDYCVTINVKPVYPLAIRVPDFFEKAHPLFFSYLIRDVMRTAEMRGKPFGKPNPDPIVMDEAARRAHPDQPYIYRLTRIAMAAKRQAPILPLIDEIGTLIWSGQTHGWDQGTYLDEAVRRAGFDLPALDAVAQNEAEALDAATTAHQDDLEKAGHWGVPTMVFQGEPFFGQDRFDHLVWRMRQHGLKERDQSTFNSDR
ncbi:MAG: DsbA family protein [Pseudomonadota bacterium]